MSSHCFFIGGEYPPLCICYGGNYPPLSIAWGGGGRCPHMPFFIGGRRLGGGGKCPAPAPDRCVQLLCHVYNLKKNLVHIGEKF